MAVLRVVEGPEEGRELRLPAYPVVLGRGSAADLILDDPRCSRTHACIEIHGGRWTVRDLDTSNGTYLDGMRIAGRAPLHTGSRVRLGRSVLLFDEQARTERDAPRIVLPGYEILDEVGRGATGSVYRARQLSLDRVVAVKVLSPRLAARDGFVERFVCEARAAAHLHHPHVVQVFDVGQHAGTHFFTMEFMQGGTVNQLLEREDSSRMAWRDAARLAADAARGLAFAEERGIVHRDVKPANLLLDERGTVKLGDLGTAVREDEAEAERIGTPHFMSPEQARREAVTHASDVYSLGATLYRMLAGRTPFPHEDDVRVLVRHVAEEEPSPVARFAPGLPPPVALLVARMMDRNPAARPTAAECVERLTKVARGVTADRTAVRRARRRRSTIAAWTVRVLFLLAVAAAVFVLRAPLRDLYTRLVAEHSVAPEPRTPGAPPAVTPARVVAQDTYGEIEAREHALDPPSAANADAWRGVARDYARMGEVFALDLEPVVRAHWRAKEIRDRLAEVTGGDETNARYADRWLARALRASGLPEDAGAGAAPSAERAPGAAEGSLLAERDATLERARALVADGDVARALDDVLAWARDRRLVAVAARADTSDHEIIAGALAWTRRTAREQSARLEQDLDTDRALLRARLGESAVFRGDGAWAAFAAAQTRLELLQPLLLTYLGSDRVAERRRRLAVAEAAWESVLAEWPDGVEPRPTASGLATGTAIIAWSEVGAFEIARSVVMPSAGRVPAAHVEGLLWLLVELDVPGLVDETLATFGRALTGDRRRALVVEMEAQRALEALGGSPNDGALAGWSRRFAGTDVGLLREGAATARHLVFADSEVERYHDTWGGSPGGDR